MTLFACVQIPYLALAVARRDEHPIRTQLCLLPARMSSLVLPHRPLPLVRRSLYHLPVKPRFWRRRRSIGCRSMPTWWSSLHCWVSGRSARSRRRVSEPSGHCFYPAHQGHLHTP
jgi:hypothetical protein